MPRLHNDKYDDLILEHYQNGTRPEEAYMYINLQSRFSGQMDVISLRTIQRRYQHFKKEGYIRNSEKHTVLPENQSVLDKVFRKGKENNE